MTIDLELGYAGLEVSDLDKWESFGRDMLGVMTSRNADGTLSFRLDDHARRVILTEGPQDDLVYIGWEAHDQATFDEVAKRLRDAGVTLTPGSDAEAAQRGVKHFTHFVDPNGLRMELYMGPEIAAEPFVSELVPEGFVTERQGLGHFALCVKNREESTRFFVDLLGMRISDYIETKIMGFPLDLTFLHSNPRHHTLAVGEIPLPKRIQHMMLQVKSEHRVGKAYDRCLEARQPIALTLGEHPNDKMFSFYVTTPSGFDIEYGTRGIEIDDSNWKVETFDKISSWGHRPVALLGEPPR